MTDRNIDPDLADEIAEWLVANLHPWPRAHQWAEALTGKQTNLTRYTQLRSEVATALARVEPGTRGEPYYARLADAALGVVYVHVAALPVQSPIRGQKDAEDYREARLRDAVLSLLDGATR